MEVTQEHIRMAKLAGACGDGLRCVKAGMKITDLPNDALRWFEEKYPEDAKEAAKALCAVTGVAVRGAISLTIFGSGYGSGYGSGSGYGYGYGYGYGSGDGYGDGYGYGYGSGDGYGYGYGYGDGYGDGSGIATA